MVVVMARMMFHNCKYGCCLQGGRAAEKRVTQKWLDDYESRHDYDGCPRDGLDCTCNKPDYECPHMDEGYWENECYGRYAIGEAFDLNPSWTLVSLRPARNRT